jgi:hypothetical protein
VAVKLLFVIVLLLNLSTGYTDADLSVQQIVANNRLRATTLELASLSTINRLAVNLWFQTIGLVPEGFDVRSVKIKNSGELDYEIIGSYQQIGGSEMACNQLNLKLSNLAGQVKYEGKINQFNWGTELKSGSEENLIGILQLKGGGGQNLSCQFDLVFKTKRQGQGGAGGFRDEKRLTNLVTIGN